MKNLLYKEFKLIINPLFFLVPLFGVLVLIPNWVYFLSLMYFFFISMPNVFTIGKAQNDIGFSVLLPVSRSDIVKARIMTVVVLELMQILVTAACVAINLAIYPVGNFLMDANIAFIGFSFIVFAVGNLFFFPLFYKTAYKIAIPVIVSMAATLIFATGVELLMIYVPYFKIVDGMDNVPAQLIVLAAGIAIFILLNIVSYKISARKFESIDV